MSAGWAAGSVRARAIARRRIGATEARRIAACGSLDEGLARLAAAYRRTGGVPHGLPGDLEAGPQALSAAQHAVAASVLWDLRVLAGWLPQGGTALMRTLAGWYEIANVTELLAELAGSGSAETFSLGALGTAWGRARRSGSLAEVRATLAASAWKDPGGETAQALAVGLRARWAQRVADLGDPARSWAASGLALLVAGERFGVGGPGRLAAEHPVLRSVAAALLGPAAASAATLDDLAGRLPRRLAWVLEGVHSPADLWRAEIAWWQRTEQDGHRLLAGPGFDQRPVVGAAVVLAADARRIGAALEIAARGGGLLEVFDAVA